MVEAILFCPQFLAQAIKCRNCYVERCDCGLNSNLSTCCLEKAEQTRYIKKHINAI